MKKLSNNKLRIHRKRRIRERVMGVANIPRLAIFRSLKAVRVQIIDDEKGITLVSASSQEAEAKNSVEGAMMVGELIAKKAMEKKISQVVFDRAGYRYHGKVKAAADGARKGGLKF